MGKIALPFALTLILLGSACRQEEPVATAPTPNVTVSPLPSPTPLQDFVLEGEVQEVWTAASASADGASASSVASPAASPTAGATPTPGGAAASPDAAGSLDKEASGAIAVELASYFSETGCAFKAGDLVVIRINPQTTVEPAELSADTAFPENLENARVTVNGNLLEPGPNCLPVAESLTVLEGAEASQAQTSGGAVRPRTRARQVRRTPSPTPARNGASGTAADPGGNSTGTSDIGVDLGEDLPENENPPSTDEESTENSNDEDTTDNGDTTDEDDSGSDQTAEDGAGGSQGSGEDQTS